MINPIKRIKMVLTVAKTMESSPLFDKEYYSSTYHVPKWLCVWYDVLLGRMFANDPSEDFSAKAYLKNYQDVKASGMPALFHYLRYGKREGRTFSGVVEEVNQCPTLYMFDKAWYRKEYLSNLPEWKKKPLNHYVEIGWKTNKKPFENFDLERFYKENPDCKEEPLGYWYKKRLPSLYFIDIIKAVTEDAPSMQQSLQYVYHYAQDQLASVLIPADHTDLKLILFMAPDYGTKDVAEIYSFQTAYCNALKNKKKNEVIVATTRPDVPTYTGDGIYPSQIRILRYCQLINKLRGWNSITLVLTDAQLGPFYEYIKYNCDEPLNHIDNKTISVLDYGCTSSLNYHLSRISDYFQQVALETIDQENPYCNPFLGFFDEKWYQEAYDVKDYDDVQWHYLYLGWRLKYKPFEFFDLDKFYKEYPDCQTEPLYYLYRNRITDYYFTKRAIPQLHLKGTAGQALQAVYRMRQECMIDKVLPYENTVKKLMVIFVSPEDAISGGIMSFYGIYHLSQQMKDIHGRDIIVTTLPGDTTQAGFTMFKNDMPVFRYELVARRVHHVEDLLIMIPEIYVNYYLEYIMQNTDDPLLQVKCRHLNIMNQKIEVMPEPDVLNHMKQYFPKMTQTVAHYKYCTKYEREYYGIPMQLLLPPIIKEFTIVPYEKKENIFAYSYDEQPWKSKVLKALKHEFPEMKFVEIVNMSFDEYLELIHRAKWCMTFGEGLDGYFSEPYQTGGISFAIWNDAYFTDRYKTLPTILPNVEAAITILPTLMRKLDNKTEYEKVSEFVRTVHGEEYATSRTSADQLKDFFEERYDYP